MFEVLTFRLAPGVDEASFRALDERIQVEFAYQQPGLVRRTLGRHSDGRWLALTIWAGDAAAADAQRAFENSDLGAAFAALAIDVHVDRFHSA
ncbi:MAG TPA: hypothetical protein VMY16_07310 [Ilumatobacteraceae bacterium]|nr:hypothetical protein [Ilumatobacteraceae bacterium]